jgi:hypothetical protein
LLLAPPLLVPPVATPLLLLLLLLPQPKKQIGTAIKTRVINRLPHVIIGNCPFRRHDLPRTCQEGPYCTCLEVFSEGNIRFTLA